MKRSLGLIDSREAFYTNSTLKPEVLPLFSALQSTTANISSGIVFGAEETFPGVSRWLHKNVFPVPTEMCHRFRFYLPTLMVCLCLKLDS